MFRDVQKDEDTGDTSQDVIKLQRNHLYKVVLSPKYELGNLNFKELSYSFQVIDWQSGETLKFFDKQGEEAKLTKQSTPSFVVEGAISVTGTEGDGKTNPTIVYTGIEDHSIYLKVTSNTTGTMLESSTFGSTKYGLVASETTNDADGNLVETYKIDIDDDVALATDYVFTLKNAINTGLSKTFTLRKAPLINNTDDIQLCDVYYTNGMWSRPEYQTILETIGYIQAGVVAPLVARRATEPELSATYCVKLFSELSLGDVYYADGFWSPSTSLSSLKTNYNPIGVVVYVSDGTTSGNNATEKDQKSTGIGGHALVMALQDAGIKSWQATSGTDHDEDLFPNISTTDYSSWQTDFQGYAKTKSLVEDSHTHDAANTAWNYSPSTNVRYKNSSTGWFLPSNGQWFTVAKAMGVTTIKSAYNGPGSAITKWKNYTTAAGGTFLTTDFYLSSSEINASNVYAIRVNETSGIDSSNDDSLAKTATYNVRPFLAF